MWGVFPKCEFQQSHGALNTNWRTVLWSPPPEAGRGWGGTRFQSRGTQGSAPLCHDFSFRSLHFFTTTTACRLLTLTSPIRQWSDGCPHHPIMAWRLCSPRIHRHALTTLNLPGSSTPGHSWRLQLERAVSSWGLFGTHQGLGPVACCSSFLESFALCSYVPSVAFTP